MDASAQNFKFFELVDWIRDKAGSGNILAYTIMCNIAIDMTKEGATVDHIKIILDRLCQRL